jgi:hypothetical protein
MKVHIHFGAHKTATTFLQNFLTSQVGDLRRRGIAYVPLAKSRRIFFPQLHELTGKLSHDVRHAKLNLLRKQVERTIQLDDKRLPPVHTLVLSDENFAGPLIDLWRKEKLYPKAGKRMAILAQLFPDSDVAFFFSIRNYADFCASAYCEVLRHHQLWGLPELMASWDEATLSWPELFDRVRIAVRGRQVTFWRYEEFNQSATAVAEALTTIKLEAIEQAKKVRVRPSLGKKAIDMLQACGPFLTKREFAQFAHYLAEKFPFEDGGGKFVINDPDIIARFSAQYAKHCKFLAESSKLLDGGLRKF